MRIFSTILLLCFLTACASPTATPPTPTPVIPTSTIPAPALTGQWIGAATKPDGTTASIQVTLADSDSESKLNIEPFTHLWKLMLEQNNEAVHFTATSKVDEPFQEIEFTGTFVNGIFSGELNWDGTASAITFTPIASVDKTLLEKYEGVYRFESGRALSIIVSPEYSSDGLYFFSQTLMLTDFDSGALRGLYPLNNTTFAVGVLRVAGAPFAGKVQFFTDTQGNVTSLKWWGDVKADDDGQAAKRVQYNKEEITFTSKDGIKLAGLLSLPESNTPVPAFMGLHGSEPGTRDNFGAKVMAHYMISRGFAILSYDKRGVGDSEGVYQEAASDSNLHKHADDATAGVAYLASRPEIDAKRIGLIGGSQAGWVIPIAASQSEQVSYFVILSGPVTSTFQEDVFSSYTNDGETVTQYDDAKITQKLRGMNPGGFNPIPILAELKQPGLWLWGSVDKNQPVTFDAENLQTLIDSGKDIFSYEIFPNGDHNLNSSPHGLFDEIPYSPHVLFYSALTKWLKTNMSKEK
ncbi:MAG: prolyl oligopeptidase family serine peptidase [Chloroflexota bacterium]